MTHIRFRTIGTLLAVVFAVTAVAAPALADERVFERKSPRDPNDIIYGGRGVSDHSAVGAVVSLIIPGLGQAINKNKTKKIVTHLVLGALYFVGFAHPAGFVFGLFHLWSCWDALIDRPGGYIDGCVYESPPVEARTLA